MKIFLLTLLAYWVSIGKGTETLLQVIEIARHGARSPIAILELTSNPSTNFINTLSLI